MKPAVWPRAAKQFVVPMFGVSVYLCTQRETYQQCMAVFGDTKKRVGVGGLCAWVESKNPEKSDFILLGVFNKSAGTLVHELGHACFFVCAYVGVPVEVGQHNETFCYMQDRLFTAMLPHIKEKH